MFLAGAFSRLGINAKAAGDVAKASAYGDAAASMIFIFTFVFGATWLTVPWLYPAEIFPLEVRAKGNAWGVVGWSIGNGWLVSCFAPNLSSPLFYFFPFLIPNPRSKFNKIQTLLCPVMFSAINEKTLYIFGISNLITIPMVWALYPESNQRTLEEMDLLFAAKTPWVWDAERTFERLKEERPEVVQAAQLGERRRSSAGGAARRGSTWSRKSKGDLEARGRFEGSGMGEKKLENAKLSGSTAGRGEL